MTNKKLNFIIPLILGIVVLSNAQEKDIFVYGTVVDSLTQEPINGALVILSTINNTFSSDSVTTNTGGTFSNVMKIDSIINTESVILYKIIKQDYLTKDGVKGTIVNDSVDLGKLSIYEPNTSVKYKGNLIPSPITPSNTIAIYSMKGQCIYTGTEMNIDKLVHLGIVSRSQPLIVTYKRNDEVLLRKKITSVRY